MAQGKCEMFPEDESHALSATQGELAGHAADDLDIDFLLDDLPSSPLSPSLLALIEAEPASDGCAQAMSMQLLPDPHEQLQLQLVHDGGKPLEALHAYQHPFSRTSPPEAWSSMQARGAAASQQCSGPVAAAALAHTWLTQDVPMQAPMASGPQGDVAAACQHGPQSAPAAYARVVTTQLAAPQPPESQLMSISSTENSLQGQLYSLANSAAGPVAATSQQQVQPSAPQLDHALAQLGQTQQLGHSRHAQMSCTQGSLLHASVLAQLGHPATHSAAPQQQTPQAGMWSGVSLTAGLPRAPLPAALTARAQGGASWGPVLAAPQTGAAPRPSVKPVLDLRHLPGPDLQPFLPPSAAVQKSASATSDGALAQVGPTAALAAAAPAAGSGYPVRRKRGRPATSATPRWARVRERVRSLAAAWHAGIAALRAAQVARRALKDRERVLLKAIEVAEEEAQLLSHYLGLRERVLQRLQQAAGSTHGQRLQQRQAGWQQRWQQQELDGCTVTGETHDDSHSRTQDAPTSSPTAAHTLHSTSSSLAVHGLASTSAAVDELTKTLASLNPFKALAYSAEVAERLGSMGQGPQSTANQPINHLSASPPSAAPVLPHGMMHGAHAAAVKGLNPCAGSAPGLQGGPHGAWDGAYDRRTHVAAVSGNSSGAASASAHGSAVTSGAVACGRGYVLQPGTAGLQASGLDLCGSMEGVDKEEEEEEDTQPRDGMEGFSVLKRVPVSHTEQQELAMIEVLTSGPTKYIYSHVLELLTDLSRFATSPEDPATRAHTFEVSRSGFIATTYMAILAPTQFWSVGLDTRLVTQSQGSTCMLLTGSQLQDTSSFPVPRRLESSGDSVQPTLPNPGAPSHGHFLTPPSFSRPIPTHASVTAWLEALRGRDQVYAASVVPPDLWARVVHGMGLKVWQVRQLKESGSLYARMMVPVLTERQQLMAASAQLQAATQRLGPFACGVQQVQLADAMHANLVKEAAAMRTLTMLFNKITSIQQGVHGVLLAFPFHLNIFDILGQLLQDDQQQRQ